MTAVNAQIPTPTGPTPARRSKNGGGATLWAGVVLIGLVLLAALVSAFWTPFDPEGVFSDSILLPPGAEHLLGTDSFGRDVFSSILRGAQISLLVGTVAVGIAALLGVPFGIVAGMNPGRLDQFMMRGNDISLAFPALLLAIIFGAIFGAGTVTAMVALGIGTAPAFALIARSGTLQVMSREYVQAARASGKSGFFIGVRHVLPNISGMLIVQASVSFGIAVLAEAALSYLGLGTPPPTPSWGRMLQDAQGYLFIEPLLIVWPGIAIAVVVLGFNLLGDGLRDRFDPKMQVNR
ncbi:ABC transporter permease [Cryobacterium sp. TMT1-3]|uniref:ABC transporter permease n=1 Tax=Cryobacterium luteum TaxID=1424661 RepID=A0A1H8EQJ9_9MICO|nr:MULTISPECIES: ABC transporter permease [Cryobacterium]TFB85771.1 ABC transporter permease [Cryobacterium luteum]TFC31392.1 ABC transporter permease [Cryobacterium sp. TMT1-3]SEN21861.1 peptide/nickel transport system permease protein [Cryobacterium luteum]